MYVCIWLLSEASFSIDFNLLDNDYSGSAVVECRTPEREVGGSKPIAAVLCP